MIIFLRLAKWIQSEHLAVAALDTHRRFKWSHIFIFELLLDVDITLRTPRHDHRHHSAIAYGEHVINLSILWAIAFRRRRNAAPRSGEILNEIEHRSYQKAIVEAVAVYYLLPAARELV